MMDDLLKSAELMITGLRWRLRQAHKRIETLEAEVKRLREEHDG